MDLYESSDDRTDSTLYTSVDFSTRGDRISRTNGLGLVISSSLARQKRGIPLLKWVLLSSVLLLCFLPLDPQFLQTAMSSFILLPSASRSRDRHVTLQITWLSL